MEMYVIDVSLSALRVAMFSLGENTTCISESKTLETGVGSRPNPPQ